MYERLIRHQQLEIMPIMGIADTNQPSELSVRLCNLSLEMDRIEIW